MIRAIAIAVLLLMCSTVIAQDNYNIDLVGSLYNHWGSSYVVEVVGNYAYVINYDTGFHVVDISDPMSPEEIGSCPIFGAVRGGLVIVGDYAYVGDGGLGVVDISDPFNPELISYYYIGTWVLDLDISNSYLYMTTAEPSIMTFSLIDPENPSLIATYTSLPAWPYGIVIDDYAYVAVADVGIEVFSIANPYGLTSMGTTATDGQCYDVTIDDSDYLYVMDGSNGLEIFQLSLPWILNPVGGLNTPGWLTKGELVDGIFYGCAQDAGLRLIDVSTPSTPVELGFHDTSGSVRDVFVTNSTAYIADFNAHLRIVDVSYPAAPVELGQYTDPGIIRHVAVAGNYVAVADDDQGLRILDTSDPAQPSEISTFTTSGNVYDVAFSGIHAYVAADDAGLRIVDVSEPTTPVEVGAFVANDVQSVFVHENHAYLCALGTVHIIDISDPAAPFETSNFTPPANVREIFVDGNLAYIADIVHGLYILDVSDPAAPVQLSLYDIQESVHGVWVENSIAYLAADNYGLCLLDVSDPENPVELYSLMTGIYGVDVFVENGYAYVADRGAGLRVFDCSDPELPVEAGFHEDIITINGLAVQDGMAYCAETRTFAIYDCSAANTSFLVELLADDPVVVPQGGNFEYGLRISSHLDTPAFVDVWTEAILPSGATYRPIWRIDQFPFAPNTVIYITAVNQAIPSFAPTGNYTYFLKVGAYPNFSLTHNSFEFEVTAATTDANSDWRATGYQAAFRHEAAIAAVETALPVEYELSSAHPNPFNAATVLKISLPRDSEIKVHLYNVTGQLVETLASGRYPAGKHTLSLDGTSLASGLYFVRATVAGELNQVRKVMLVR